MSDNYRLIDVTLDSGSFSRATPDVEHERAVAIFDLIEENSFKPCGDDGGGPYKLKLGVMDSKLVFHITREDDEVVITHFLSMSPFQRVIKDYFLICDSYYEAIKSSSPAQIEAIDMGRRGIHNDGSEILADRLKDKIEFDMDTARRLFTLICALQWRG